MPIKPAIYINQYELKPDYVANVFYSPCSKSIGILFAREAMLESIKQFEIKEMTPADLTALLNITCD